MASKRNSIKRSSLILDLKSLKDHQDLVNLINDPLSTKSNIPSTPPPRSHKRMSLYFEPHAVQINNYNRTISPTSKPCSPVTITSTTTSDQRSALFSNSEYGSNRSSRSSLLSMSSSIHDFLYLECELKEKKHNNRLSSTVAMLKHYNDDMILVNKNNTTKKNIPYVQHENAEDKSHVEDKEEEEDFDVLAYNYTPAPINNNHRKNKLFRKQRNYLFAANNSTSPNSINRHKKECIDNDLINDIWKSLNKRTPEYIVDVDYTRTPLDF
ncbi:uncharacterized protein SCDLUD_003717 [Saccharomycodes ludwigii]|uniref:uncharacterized protein n=1 Tax=Saccharomycodes ludwigii TaxID=36035 RepID=UPI001E81F588|nr:hypothetical protein SCDLUD_003717 [Saccharomycodes ludwigii]KAH3900715.1 hypothetical protein SCDLUD_003717 [Saccharomycodes ludwigii]